MTVTTSPRSVPNDPATTRSLREASPKGRVSRRFISLTGPVMRPLAGRAWFKLWGLMRHTGRRSGRTYATPIALRPTEAGFVIPLPFGASTEWVRNIPAAHGGALRWGGREFVLSDPVVLERAEALPAFSPPLRVGVRLLGIEQFLRVRRQAADR
jgi:hypothetical protein